MTEFCNPCLVCNHYDHFITDAGREFFGLKKFCWSKQEAKWIFNCECPKHVEANLEYLEYLYDKKNKESL